MVELETVSTIVFGETQIPLTEILRTLSNLYVNIYFLLCKFYFQLWTWVYYYLLSISWHLYWIRWGFRNATILDKLYLRTTWYMYIWIVLFYLYMYMHNVLFYRNLFKTKIIHNCHVQCKKNIARLLKLL